VIEVPGAHFMRAQIGRVARGLGGSADARRDEISPNADYAGFPEEELDGEFETERGFRLPVLKSYRYGLKAAWENFSALSVLSALDKLGLLDTAGKTALAKFKGSRALSVPLDEAIEFAQPYADRHPDLFINRKVGRLGKRVLKPKADKVAKSIETIAAAHRRKLQRLRSQGFHPSSRPRVLEIGYISGGESVVAFERLGFEAHGIDYFYAGQFEEIQRWELILDLTGTKVGFHLGDITKKTEFPDDYFDLVYSAQTLEHIADLPAAFAEMNRILAPGGAMLHVYEPYFHPLGGHSFGTLDFPYGHVRLSTDDVDRYLTQFRPHEAVETIPWIRSSLNRSHTQQRVQSAITAAGFSLAWWQSEPVSKEWQAWLSRDTVADAFRECPGTTLADLRDRSISFSATKP